MFPWFNDLLGCEWVGVIAIQDSRGLKGNMETAQRESDLGIDMNQIFFPQIDQRKESPPLLSCRSPTCEPISAMNTCPELGVERSSVPPGVPGKKLLLKELMDPFLLSLRVHQSWEANIR